MLDQDNISTDTLVVCNSSSTYPIPRKHVEMKEWHIEGKAAYDSIYNYSVEYSEEFWAEKARTELQWERPFKSVMKGEFSNGTARWFSDGKLNAAYNCVDRHDPHKVAMIWESDTPGMTRRITFGELKDESSRLCNYLQSIGTKLGDVVTIYMPMVPEAVFAMLACARMGVMHNVVFAGFSAESLKDRLIDSGSGVLITADMGFRGGKTIPLGQMVETALSGSIEGLEKLKHVLWYRRGSEGHFTPRNDYKFLSSSRWWHEVIPTQSINFDPVPVPADTPLFMLYTSGSTGKPKGLVHSTAGYLLYAMTTAKWTFNLEQDTNIIFGCLADIGWITGHTYVVYGPLALGVTTVLFEGTPTHPSPSRYWELVDRLHLTHLYTAPTVLRALKKLGDHHVEQFKLNSLRVLGSVGEPINPEAWKWYYEVVGRGKCAVVDTYWQTETGGHIITPLPGAIATKAGSATFPFPGIKIELLDQVTGTILDGPNVTGVLVVAKPWPGMAMTIHGDHQKFLQTYLQPYPGKYFTGDRGFRDHEMYYWVRGRADDVINVSGHRLSTAEIEAAVCKHSNCAEAAVIGRPDDITGEAIWIFCLVKVMPDNKDGCAELQRETIAGVRSAIGAFATPAQVILVEDLPKTRSGKIMRRVLRRIATNNEDLGDLSTLYNPDVISHLKYKINAILKTD